LSSPRLLAERRGKRPRRGDAVVLAGGAFRYTLVLEQRRRGRHGWWARPIGAESAERDRFLAAEDFRVGLVWDGRAWVTNTDAPEPAGKPA
jgi:hypothetical protein